MVFNISYIKQNMNEKNQNKYDDTFNGIFNVLFVSDFTMVIHLNI